VLSFALVILVFSILIIVHELGHMLAAKSVGVKVEKFSLGFGKKLFSIKKGDTEYILSLFPLGGYVKLAGDDVQSLKGTPEEFYSKSVFKRFLIIVSGALTNYIFAFLLFVAIFTIGVPMHTASVGKLIPDYPAATSGLKEGDIVLAIDNKDVKYWSDLLNIVGQNITGRPLDFSVKRGKKNLHFKISPKIIKTKNIFGKEIIVGKIGIYNSEEIIPLKHNIFQAVILGGKQLFMFIGVTYKGLWLLITGGLPFRESVMGPIGIGSLIGQQAKLGIVNLLNIMAHINIALAVFNLLPFPILDGGHIVFLGIEKLRGKPVSLRVQELISQVGFYILIAFALFVCWNDMTKFLPFMRK